MQGHKVHIHRLHGFVGQLLVQLWLAPMQTLALYGMHYAPQQKRQLAGDGGTGRCQVQAAPISARGAVGGDQIAYRSSPKPCRTHPHH